MPNERPPLDQPAARPPAPGDPAPSFRPSTGGEPTPPARRRFTRTHAAIAIVTAFVLLLVALGFQTWRLTTVRANATGTTSASGQATPPSTRPGSATTPSTTPGTTAPTLPNGLNQFASVPGIQCLADLIGKSPTAKISRNTLNAQINTIATWDEQARELEFTQLPEPSLLTPDELTAKVQQEVDQSYSPAEAALDSRLLGALGAVPPGFDMRAGTSALLGDQVAGFYDPSTKQLVLGTNDARRPLSSVGEVTLAHELIHALTDQIVGLPSLDVTTTPAGVLDPDRVQARRSLVEGDATLVMDRFTLSALSAQQQLQILNDPALKGQNGSLATVPNYLRDQLTFPYEAGLDFTCALQRAGGWKAVNGAYSQPPSTSAQILFPDRFASREAAADPADPGALGGPWIKDRAQTFGAADLLSLFKAPGDNPAVALPDPKAATAAWGGGETVQWSNGNQTAVGLSLAERSAGGGGLASSLAFHPAQVEPPTTTPAGPAPGARRLCDSIRDWYSAAFPGGRDGAPNGDEVKVWDGDRQHAVLRCVNGNVRLGMGPDVETARALTR
jgi:hypothetical protein